MENEKIGSFIAKLRKENNLTQKDLADKLGITDRAVSKWERGICCPDISLLDDLSRIFNVSILELLKGRKLDKDEILENKDLIDTLNFAETYGKNKIRNYINKLSVLVIILISLFLAYSNIKSIYLNNKTYNTIPETFNPSSDGLFENTLNNIELILNNKGKYSNEDYKRIVKYVNDVKYFIDIENDKGLFEKEKYAYQDIINESTTTIYEVYGFDFPNNNIYEVIIKYDVTKLKNANHYYTMQSEYLNVTNEISEFLRSTYYYNKTLNVDIAFKLKEKIFYKYFLYKLSLEDIIEVGDIHE